jgi:anti-sigma B factor antagonist
MPSSGTDPPTFAAQSDLPTAGGAGTGLRTEIDRNADVTTVTLHGEIDVFTAADVRNAIDKALADRPTTLLIDVSGVTFCDSSGMHVFCIAADDCAERGMHFELCGATPNVSRVLEICGLGHMMKPGATR